MRVNRANLEYAAAEHQRRSQEVQNERAQQEARDLLARPQHMAELARRRVIVETNAVAEQRARDVPRVRAMGNDLRIQPRPATNAQDAGKWYRLKMGRLHIDQRGKPDAIQCVHHERNVLSSLLLYCSKSVPENVTCWEQFSRLRCVPVS